jgi:CBS-domain-containing membrane protein
MLVRDVMTRPAITVRADVPLKEATTLLDARSITTLPVVDSRGRPVGVVSEADVISGMVPRDTRLHMAPSATEAHILPPETVGEVMNPHPMTVSESTDLAEAADLLTSTGVKSLPVLDEHGRVVGMVSRRDIIHLLARPDSEIEAELDDAFRRLGRDWLVDVSGGVVTVTGPVGAGEHGLAATLAETVAGVTAVVVR